MKGVVNICFAAACVAGVLCLSSCRGDGSVGAAADGGVAQSALRTDVVFDQDSAYAYVRQQVDMGPRVSGSEASRRCVEYISSELRRHGASDVKLQSGEMTAWDGKTLPLTNVMGSFNPDARKRVLLVAHFDSRPWADNDPTEELRMKPVPGANDGASGVGVLLEAARQLGKSEAPVGVDLLFVDAEDYGQSSGFSHHDESWCLGTQYWTAHMPYAQDSLPAYAILLDMVGGIGARFHREYFSNASARDVVDKVWGVASRSGYGERFVNQDGGAVIDDHVFLNKAGIPSIDIIESMNAETKSFPSTWHTAADDMDSIDPNSLKAVGQTVLNVIYNEK